MWTDQTFDNTLCFVGRPCQNSQTIVLTPPGPTITPLLPNPPPPLPHSSWLHLHMRTSDHVEKAQRDLTLNEMLQRDVGIWST